MTKSDVRELIQIPQYYSSDRPKIHLKNGYAEVGKENWIAVGLEKSRAAQGWEDMDYFNITILVQANDGKYYICQIEHPADVLSPRNLHDELNIYWLKEDAKPAENELISNLYALVDSRSTYTLSVEEKPYQIYEKYICYNISVSYDTWEHYDKSKIEVSGLFQVRCRFSSQHPASDLDDIPTRTLIYQIYSDPLLQASVFEYQPFELWQGNVTIDGFKVRLESK